MRRDEKKDKKNAYHLAFGKLASKPHVLRCKRAGARRAKGRKHYVCSGIPVLEVKNGRTRVGRNFQITVGSFVEKCKNALNGKGVISTTQSVSFAAGRKHESEIVDFSLVLEAFCSFRNRSQPQTGSADLVM